MNVQTATYGGLGCKVVDQLSAGEQPQMVVIFCHGFGAPGTDLVALGPELLTIEPSLAGKLRFVFPAAPLSLAEMGMPGGLAWWHIDMLRLTEAIEAGELRDMRSEVPDGLPESREKLFAAIEEIKQETGLSTSNLVLGGFSQGSMLATDVALRLPEAPAGLCIFSGTLLCEPEWRAIAKNRARLPVLQSHGHEDPILQYQAAEWLRDMLVEAGLEVDFIPFHGYHSIPMEALNKSARLLSRLVGT